MNFWSKVIHWGSTQWQDMNYDFLKQYLPHYVGLIIKSFQYTRDIIKKEYDFIVHILLGL